MLLTGRDYEDRDALLAEINRRVEENLKQDSVVISVGMSDYVPGKDAEFHVVFERADALMYQRKNALKAMGAKTR